jgi:prophage tail gpP-like protein
MTKPDVRLHLAGQSYGGWQSIHIKRGLEQVAGTFELSVSERWPGQDVPRPIRPGAACTLRVDGRTVITGWVDDVSVSYDAREHTVSVSGRDATGDLVDCSAPSTQFALFTLAEIAEQLCQPYGIGVINRAGRGLPFQRMKNNEGDTVFEALEAAARCRGVLLLSDGQGNLVISRVAGQRVRTPLVLGENILSMSAQFSDRDRFSEYTIKGQTVGTDDWSGESAAQPAGRAVDKAITRHRPLTVLAEEQADGATAQERAEWERNVRYGRSRSLSVTVQGWTNESGLWMPNRLVRLCDSWLGMDRDLLISEVGLVLDEQGLRSELKLCPPETFERLPLPEPGGNDGGWM